ncbi:MAG: hypothetical protein JWO38_2889 [Gemmataceae bacterium]|nr:hypothetical protein [Gemmataceae bacterium]
MRCFTCPTCGINLPGADIQAGWCESCGKKIPAFAYREAGTELPAPRSPAPTRPRPARPTGTEQLRGPRGGTCCSV